MYDLFYFVFCSITLQQKTTIFWLINPSIHNSLSNSVGNWPEFYSQTDWWSTTSWLIIFISAFFLVHLLTSDILSNFSKFLLPTFIQIYKLMKKKQTKTLLYFIFCSFTSKIICSKKCVTKNRIFRLVDFETYFSHFIKFLEISVANIYTNL